MKVLNSQVRKAIKKEEIYREKVQNKLSILDKRKKTFEEEYLLRLKSLFFNLSHQELFKLLKNNKLSPHFLQDITNILYTTDIGLNNPLPKESDKLLNILKKDVVHTYKIHHKLLLKIIQASFPYLPGFEPKDKLIKNILNMKKETLNKYNKLQPKIDCTTNTLKFLDNFSKLDFYTKTPNWRRNMPAIMKKRIIKVIGGESLSSKDLKLLTSFEKKYGFSTKELRDCFYIDTNISSIDTNIFSINDFLHPSFPIYQDALLIDKEKVFYNKIGGKKWIGTPFWFFRTSKIGKVGTPSVKKVLDNLKECKKSDVIQIIGGSWIKDMEVEFIVLVISKDKHSHLHTTTFDYNRFFTLAKNVDYDSISILHHKQNCNILAFYKAGKIVGALAQYIF